MSPTRCFLHIASLYSTSEASRQVCATSSLLPALRIFNYTPAGRSCAPTAASFDTTSRVMASQRRPSRGGRRSL
jgi:hypothetical protein